MSAATIIAQGFGEGADLYNVLGTTPDATAAQLRKAYYQKALLYHPDKQQGEEAKAKFQAISVAYDILKNPEKRAEYDESGELVEDDDELNKAGCDMWRNYFSQIFGQISTSDIDNFAQKYKCSDEEEEEVLKYYARFKGDLTKMLDCVMLSNECDKKRWVEDFIRPAIERGDVEDYSDKLNKTMKDDDDEDDDEVIVEVVVDEDETESEEDNEKQPARKKGNQAVQKPKTKVPPKKKKANTKASKKREKEAAEAEALMAKIRNKKSLAQRKMGFENLLSGIKDKYGVTEPDPMDNDEFEKFQAQMKWKRKG